MSVSYCGTSVANTGGIPCDKSRGVGKKIFIYNGSLPDADSETEEELFNKLVEYSKLSKDDSNKVFPFSEMQDIADASEANTEGTLGLGFKMVLREGKPVYTIKMFAGADELKRWRTWNNKTVRLLEWDANSTLWGTKSGTNKKGFQAKLFFTGNKLATGQNIEEGVVTLTLSILSTSEYFDNAYWADLADYNIEDIVSLIDVPLAYVSAASNVHQISMKISGSNIIEPYNIFDTHGAAIAGMDADFSALSGAGTPATALAITSVAVNNTLKTLAVTYDNTAYGTATGNIKLIPPTPAELDAADVTNIELLSVTYAKP
jgi:hypothetical protein